MRTATSARSTTARRTDVTRLQERLAFRLLLVFALPAVVIAVLGVYAYQLSARVAEVEVLERVSYVDRIYRETHNVPWALAEYESLAEAHPRNARIFVRLGALYHEDGQDDRAVDFLNRALAIESDSWEAHSTLAYVQLSRGRLAEAIREGEAAIRHNDADVQAYNNLAWIYATAKDERLRDLPRAVAYAEKAVKSTRCRQHDYLDTLAEAYRRSGRSAEAARVTPGGASDLPLCARAALAAAAREGR
jgi:tetratricopeptide (TPR) repeat protein